jgi:hypothetical protein
LLAKFAQVPVNFAEPVAEPVTESLNGVAKVREPSNQNRIRPTLFIYGHKLKGLLSIPNNAAEPRRWCNVLSVNSRWCGSAEPSGYPFNREFVGLRERGNQNGSALRE